MKHTLRSSLAILALAAFLPSCSTCPLGCGPKKGSIQHVVLTWLKKPGDAAGRAKLVAAAKSLKADISQVKSLAVGQPSMSDRPVVDDSFDVALVMRFDSKADLAAYESSPIHQKAVKEILGPLTQKIVVHDIISE
jgi:Stress responsive A/B Barrel Domain